MQLKGFLFLFTIYINSFSLKLINKMKQVDLIEINKCFSVFKLYQFINTQVIHKQTKDVLKRSISFYNASLNKPISLKTANFSFRTIANLYAKQDFQTLKKTTNH